MLWLNDLFNARIITNHNSLLVTVLFAQQFYKPEVFSSSSVKFSQVFSSKKKKEVMSDL